MRKRYRKIESHFKMIDSLTVQFSELQQAELQIRMKI